MRNFIRIHPHLILLSPLLFILSFLFVAPILYGLTVSFYEFDPIYFWRERLTLDNYIDFFSEEYYQKTLFRTIMLATIVTGLTLLIGYPVAYTLARIKKGSIRTFVLATLLSPYFVSVLVRLYGWIYILSDDGLINKTLMSLGIISEPVHMLWNINGVIIGLVEISLTIAIFTMYGIIGAINPELERAARTLGATPLQTFWKITFPLSLPGVVSASMLALGMNIGAFLHPWLIGGGRVETLGTIVYGRIWGVINYPFGTAVGFIMLGIFLLFLIIYIKTVKKLSTVPLGF